MTTFSKIFEDRTNKFSEKLEKFKEHIGHKQMTHLRKLEERDDAILDMYFENEKRVYGEESVLGQVKM